MSDAGDERLVLSEVHVGCSSGNGPSSEEIVSRYRYLTPSRRLGDASSPSGSDSNTSDSDISVPRRRKRLRPAETSTALASTANQQQQQQASRPAHECLTIVHRMATTLDLVGQQVWSAAFLLADFVLTHEDLFAGMQVRVSFRYLLPAAGDTPEVLRFNAEAARHRGCPKRAIMA